MLALRAECLETGLLSSMEARRSNPDGWCFICIGAPADRSNPGVLSNGFLVTDFVKYGRRGNTLLQLGRGRVSEAILF